MRAGRSRATPLIGGEGFAPALRANTVARKRLVRGRQTIRITTPV